MNSQEVVKTAQLQKQTAQLPCALPPASPHAGSFHGALARPGRGHWCKITDFTNFRCLHLCLHGCAVPHNFPLHVDSRNPNQDTLFREHSVPSLPRCAPPLCLTPGDHCSILQLCNFVILRMTKSPGYCVFKI